MTGSRLGTWVLVLVVALIPSGFGFAASPAASTGFRGTQEAPAAAAPPVRITVDSLSPLVAQSGSRTVLSGTLTNTTANPVSDLGLRFGTSYGRYTSVVALEAALVESHPTSTRQLMAKRTEIPASLPAGAAAPWKAVFPTHAFDALANGVYSLQISVRSSSSFETLGFQRVALPWFDSPYGEEPTDPMRVAVLLPLAAPPGRTVTGTLLDDRVPREIAADGRLSRIVDAAAANPDKVTWVVDPALLQTVQQMSDGYSIASPDGTAGPAQPGTTAAAWLAKLRAVTGPTSVDVLALPYADLDVTSLAGRGMATDITLASTSGPELTGSLLGKTDLRTLAWPAGTVTTAETLNALHVSGVRLANLDRQALSGLGSQTAAVSIDTKSGPISALVGDAALASTLSGESGGQPITGVAQRQLLLAQTAIYSQVERRSSVVVVPPLEWSADPTALSGVFAALGSAPWTRPARVNDVVADRPVLSARALTPMTADARRQLLPAKYLRSIRAQQAQVSLLAAITAPASIAADFTAGLLRAESAAWRSDRSAADRLSQLNARQLETTTDKIRPVASSVITFSEGGGNVPVTVANGLKVPVRVGIKLVADPAVRLVPTAPVVVEIPASTKVSTELPTQVLGAGALPVDIQLTTPDGQDFGKPTRTTLRTTAYATAASYVVIAAFLALTTTVVVSSIRRRRRLATDKNTESSPDG